MPYFPNKLTLKYKLIFIQLITSIVAIVLCGTLFLYSYYNMYKNREIENIHSIAQVMGASIGPIIDFSEINPEYIKNADIELNNLRVQSKIKNAAIFSKDEIVSHYNQGTEQYYFVPPNPTQPPWLVMPDNDYINFYYQIYDERLNEDKKDDTQKLLGTLCLRVFLNTNAILYEFVKIIPLGLLLAIIVSLILSNILQKSISQPIQKLALTMEQVAHKQDYGVRLKQDGYDETIILATVFNEMLDHIQKRDQNLLLINDQLEVRVVERTKELHEKTKSLEISNKELEQFAYIASHDLQEPLRMIGSFTQVIAKRYTNNLDEEANEFIGFIVDGVNRMQRLIKDLLLFSRVGTQKNDFRPIPFNQILDTVTFNLKFAIEECNAQINYHKNLPTIIVDEVKFIQLFQNLISNSIKFQNNAIFPIININLTEYDKYWHFSISDNGIGIDKKYIEKIFFIFQRGNSTPSQPGSGIGLAICKKVVEIHGGKIWFESEPGNGTTFYFTILKNQPEMLPTNYNENIG